MCLGKRKKPFVRRGMFCGVLLVSVYTDKVVACGKASVEHANGEHP